MMSHDTIEKFLHQLERIATALERISPAPTERVEAPEKPQNAPEPEQVETLEPAAAPAPVAPAQPEEKPSITLDQIRKKVVTLSALGKEKKDAVREIIMSYGRNVSSVPADKYPEVMDRLNAVQEG